MLQVYLVTGGGPEPYTASTELLVEGEAGWRLSGPLPRAVMGLRAASINNMVIATGEVIIIEKIVDDPVSSSGGTDGVFWSDSILQFSPATQDWAQVAVMEVARAAHAVSVVTEDDILDYCQ